MQPNDYNPSEIEKKWQDYWNKNNTYTVQNKVDGKENFYALSEFAYPSGNLHVGHWYAFAVPDIYARYKRMNGYNVLYPVGFDAFGLPAENAAIKHGKDPKKWTYDNMESMRVQLRSMGASFDWNREIATCEPSYYKWTQWMFTKFLEHDLVYRAVTKVNWCEQDKTILANEQVTGGVCERCGNDVVQKDMAQWMLKISEFADDLVDDLDALDWDESIKQSQREWIGRKEGSEIGFRIQGAENKNNVIKVFTTRADTLYGVTYVVLSPEHKLVQNLKSQITNREDVENYLKEVEKKSDLDRQQSKEKTGVELKGIKVIHPATGETISVWIADYVLAHFGTGAVMAVPSHDERDCEFALKYDLPFKFVILPSAGEVGFSRPLEVSGEVATIIAAGSTEEEGQPKINAQWNQMYDMLAEMPNGVMPVGKRFCCNFEGKVINSQGFNGSPSGQAKKNITENVQGTMTKTYRLRDWGISRQRYWGTPIPVVYDPDGKAHYVPSEHLPWLLPEDVDFTPDGTAPLNRSKELKERTEKIFGKGWTPEVDTMDAFVDSSWYFFRYLDNENTEEFASREAMESWMPVDMYFGGAEHTTMHLLYSRFWTKALHKLGFVKENEPYKGRLNRGLIDGPDGKKMSKSKGNVINPDEVVTHVGADTVRMYLAFIGPFNEPGNYPWDPNGVVGIKRFLERVWKLQQKTSNDSSSQEFLHHLHVTIKKVSEDIERLKLNTAISALMILLNEAEKETFLNIKDYESILLLLAPFAPHISEELWMKYNSNSIHLNSFPRYDEALLVTQERMIPIQINGKRRSEVVVRNDDDESQIKNRVLGLPELQKWFDHKRIEKFIYVKDRIINILVM